MPSPTGDGIPWHRFGIWANTARLGTTRRLHRELPAMHHDSPLLIGLDLGTGGVRAMAVTSSGEVAAEAAVAFDPALLAAQPGRHEQPADAWWQATCRATAMLVDRLRAAGHRPEQLAAMAVDGTSGTVVPLDAGGQPLRPAMMYNDPRATAEADRLNALAGDFCRKLGYRFGSSFALAKILWLQGNEPECFRRTKVFVHQADYVVGQLSGVPPRTDYSNALKTGYDLVGDEWPRWIEQLPGVRERLPAVVAPGTPIGTVTSGSSAQTGLPAGMPVVAGATDGVAAFLASGASRPGDYNTSLGTTLIFKGISRRICRHPQGLIYCHKLPGGLWLPGAASNTGGEWIGVMFPGWDPAAMDAAAASHLPSLVPVYPLTRIGERFPFLCPTARGFFAEEPAAPAARYAAALQGVAFLERLAYDVLDEAAGTVGGEVYSTGGGSRSEVWLRCRANATGRTIHRPACAESAFGAAVLAASGTVYGGLPEAIGRMVHLAQTFLPDPGLVSRYETLYRRFCGELVKRGYFEHLQTV
jgi:sugar (pentulose or hexulose) kinase